MSTITSNWRCGDHQNKVIHRWNIKQNWYAKHNHVTYYLELKVWWSPQQSHSQMKHIFLVDFRLKRHRLSTVQSFDVSFDIVTLIGFVRAVSTGIGLFSRVDPLMAPEVGGIPSHVTALTANELYRLLQKIFIRAIGICRLPSVTGNAPWALWKRNMARS